MSNIKRIGFGAWQLGGANIVNGKNIGWADLDDNKSAQLVSEAIKLGISFFDTSDAYGNGRSEKILGEVIGSDPAIDICTKFGAIKDGDTYTNNFSADYAEKALHKSLKRLNRSSISHFLLHSPAPNLISTELINRLNKLKSEGLIGSFGISVSFLEPYQQFFEAFDCFEILYNPLTTQNLVFLPILNNKQLFARSIFSSGLLLKPVEFWQNPYFTDYRSNLPQALLENAKNFAEKNQNIEHRYASVLDNCMMHSFSSVILGFSATNQLQQLENYINKQKV